MTLTDPESGTTHYTYDTLNRLTGLNDFQSHNFTFGYDALSRRSQLTRPNGINTNYSYDNVSHLLSVLHQLGSTTVDGASYVYDSAGNRTAKTDQASSVTSNYGYDAIYQLTGVSQGSTSTESYTYDTVGNRLSSLGVSPYSYNSSNELTSTPSTTYTYDNNGSTVTKVDSTGTTTYTWDYVNQLSSVALPGSGGTVSFKYDPFGRRIQKSGPSGTVNYLYDGPNPLEEVDQNGNVLARYTQSGLIDEPLSELRASTTSYYEQDGIDAVTSLSNSAGALANTYSYDCFGKLTASTGTITNPFQYTSREFDLETGLLNYRARYYDPTIGRFVSEDPIGFHAGVNFYDYVLNRPTVFLDPTGLAGGPYGTYEKTRSWGSKIKCAIYLVYCTRNLQQTRDSLDNMTDQAVTNTSDATSNQGSYSNQRLQCGLSQDPNCQKALENCVKLGLTNPFPPPSWMKDLINYFSQPSSTQPTPPPTQP